MATVKWRTMGNNKRSRPRRPLPITRAVLLDVEEEDGGAHQAWFARQSFEMFTHYPCREHDEPAIRCNSF